MIESVFLSAPYMIDTMRHATQGEVLKESTPAWKLNAMWNTPANQMERLRDAGLNPNLAYGSVNTGNMSGVSNSSSSGSGHDNSFMQTMDFLNSLVGLYSAISADKRENKKLELSERAQDLDALKFQSAIAHQQDAMELERKRMAVDLAFKNSELSRKDRDYELRKAQFDWQKTKPQGGVSGYVDKLISATLGRSPTDVASDTGNFLNYAIANLFDNFIVKPAGVVNFIKYNSDLGSGMSKIRY